MPTLPVHALLEPAPSLPEDPQLLSPRYWGASDPGSHHAWPTRPTERDNPTLPREGLALRGCPVSGCAMTLRTDATSPLLKLQCVSLTDVTRSMAGMWIRRFPDAVSLERQVNLTGWDCAPLLRVLSNVGTNILIPPTSDQGTPTTRQGVKMLTFSLQSWHGAKSPLQRPFKIPTLL